MLQLVGNFHLPLFRWSSLERRDSWMTLRESLVDFGHIWFFQLLYFEVLGSNSFLDRKIVCHLVGNGLFSPVPPSSLQARLMNENSERVWNSLRVQGPLRRPYQTFNFFVWTSFFRIPSEIDRQCKITLVMSTFHITNTSQFSRKHFWIFFF